jgi:NAD(P)-dependent dehydrogenase (short-subunit alcohol dehydrogenase family)
MATNVTGFFHMTQRAIEIMNSQGNGHVVTVTSSLVDQPMSSVPGTLTSLTKGVLNAATKSLAIEYAKNGVRVNAVSAGIVKTPMHPPEAHQFLASLHPMGRMGEESDVVDAVMYLDSARFVTGEILHVDGGQAAGHHAI